MALMNRSALGLTAGFYGGTGEVDWFLENAEAGVTYVNRPQGATTGAWPGYQAFGGWKGSGSTGKAIGSFYYLPQRSEEHTSELQSPCNPGCRLLLETKRRPTRPRVLDMLGTAGRTTRARCVASSGSPRVPCRPALSLWEPRAPSLRRSLVRPSARTI